MKPPRFLRFTLAFLLFAVAANAADLSITAANVKPSKDAKIDNISYAGVTLIAGQVVYKDPTDHRLKLADANAISPIYIVYGIVLNGASTGQRCAVVTDDPNLTLGASPAAGSIGVLSATAGGQCVVDTTVPQPTAGWFVTVLWVSKGGGVVNFHPLATGVVTP